MLNIFNPTSDLVSDKAKETPKATEEASVNTGRLKWYESPLMFIAVITCMLICIHWVERKV